MSEEVRSKVGSKEEDNKIDSGLPSALADGLIISNKAKTKSGKMIDE